MWVPVAVRRVANCYTPFTLLLLYWQYYDIQNIQIMYQFHCQNWPTLPCYIIYLFSISEKNPPTTFWVTLSTNNKASRQYLWKQRTFAKSNRENNVEFCKWGRLSYATADSGITIRMVETLRLTPQLPKQEAHCRRWTVRRAVSVEAVRNVAQILVELHFKSLATGHLQGHSRSLEMAQINRPYDNFY